MTYLTIPIFRGARRAQDYSTRMWRISGELSKMHSDCNSYTLILTLFLFIRIRSYIHSFSKYFEHFLCYQMLEMIRFWMLERGLCP